MITKLTGTLNRVKDDAALKQAEVAISYGAFLNTVIQFLIVAFVVFLIVRVVNTLKREEAVAPSAPPAPTPSEGLLREIRDLLADRPPSPLR